MSITRPPTRVGASRWALPDPRLADADGVVGVGADLAPSTLVEAYSHGVFPWPHDDMPLPWFSPDPRALIPADAIHISRSLRRRLRTSGWTTTVDADFCSVVDRCSDRPGQGTWITDEMRSAYRRLHELGWAHSLEVWAEDVLVGGVYGVQVGGVFTGESMFHGEADASKAALVDLCARLLSAGGEWLDVQLTTPHLTSLGAVELPRARFLDVLDQLRDRSVPLSTDRLPVVRLA